MTRATYIAEALSKPAGPYSHAAAIGNTVCSAGQAGTSPDGSLLNGIAAQADRCFRNVLAALEAGGAVETDVVKVTVYLTELEHFTEMNEAFEVVFSDPYPARTTIYVTLPRGMLIEADAIAIT